MQDTRSHTPRELQMPDVVTLEIEGMGDQYEVDSGADPEDNDNGNDAALLLSVREVVDRSRDTAGMVHQRLARTAQQTEEDLEQEDISDEQPFRS
jgi:hypothetical protein